MATKQVDKLGFDRIEIANVRRCFQANAANYTKLDKLYAKVRALGDEIKSIQDLIDAWEAPVKALSEKKLGKVLSSKEILLAHVNWEEFVKVHPEYSEKSNENESEETPNESEGTLEPEAETLETPAF